MENLESFEKMIVIAKLADRVNEVVDEESGDVPVTVSLETIKTLVGCGGILMASDAVLNDAESLKGIVDSLYSAMTSILEQYDAEYDKGGESVH